MLPWSLGSGHTRQRGTGPRGWGWAVMPMRMMTCHVFSGQGMNPPDLESPEHPEHPKIPTLS